jgi:hypothetical protein
VATTNAYKLYEELYKEAKAQKKEGLPPKWSHLEFIEELCFDFFRRLHLCKSCS